MRPELCTELQIPGIKPYRVRLPLVQTLSCLELWPKLKERIYRYAQSEKERGNLYFRGINGFAVIDEIYKCVNEYGFVGETHFAESMEEILQSVIRKEDIPSERCFDLVQNVYGGLPKWIEKYFQQEHSVTKSSMYRYVSCSLTEWRDFAKASCYEDIDKFMAWHTSKYDTSLYTGLSLKCYNDEELKIFLKIFMDSELTKVRISCEDAKASLKAFNDAVESAALTGERRENTHRLILELYGGNEMIIWVTDVGTSAQRINKLKDAAEPVVGVAQLVTGTFNLLFRRKK